MYTTPFYNSTKKSFYIRQPFKETIDGSGSSLRVRSWVLRVGDQVLGVVVGEIKVLVIFSTLKGDAMLTSH